MLYGQIDLEHYSHATASAAELLRLDDSMIPWLIAISFICLDFVRFYGFHAFHGSEVESWMQTEPCPSRNLCSIFWGFMRFYWFHASHGSEVKSECNRSPATTETGLRGQILNANAVLPLRKHLLDHSWPLFNDSLRFDLISYISWLFTAPRSNPECKRSLPLS